MARWLLVTALPLINAFVVAFAVERLQCTESIVLVQLWAGNTFAAASAGKHRKTDVSVSGRARAFEKGLQSVHDSARVNNSLNEKGNAVDSSFRWADESRWTVQKAGHDGELTTGGAVADGSDEVAQTSIESSDMPPRPHIIFVLADDMGYGGIGYNRKAFQTPGLNELAASGVKLDQFYAYSACSPSRFSLLTGRYAFKSEGAVDNNPPFFPKGTHLRYKMLPESLKQAGYDTHMIGKWHQGFHRLEYMPTQRGFNTFFGIVAAQTSHFSFENVRSVFSNCLYRDRHMIDLTEGSSPTKPRENSFGDTEYTDRAVDLILNHPAQSGGKPLFLYLSLQLPHAPYEVPRVYKEMIGFPNGPARTYLAMAAHVDNSTMRVVNALKQAAMFENSILVFASDNGAAKDAPVRANLPLRGHKDELFEGGLRVPSFVSGGFLPVSARGRILRGLFSISDWYATLARVAGAKLDQGGPHEMDSVDQWAYVIGKRAAPRTEIVHRVPLGPLNDSALRVGKWKVVVSRKGGCPFEKPCLFNIEADPSEKDDVAATRQDVMRKLRARLLQIAESTDRLPFWLASQDESSKDELIERACHAWQKAGGYLVPWATETDEQRLVTTHRDAKSSFSFNAGYLSERGV